MYSMLVCGFNPSEKYEFVSWDYYSQCMENSKMIQTTSQHDSCILMLRFFVVI